MDKLKLRRYRKNKGKLSRIDEKIDQLCGKEIDVVSGKVVGSSADFPYTEVRTTVQMYQPEENDRVNAEIRKKEAERLVVQSEITEVEDYIAEIPDPEVREIFELLYLSKNSQHEVGDMFGYTQGRISQIVSEYLKD